MPTTYNADQIIDKSLIARKDITLRRRPDPSSPVIYTVPAGQVVGRVYSYTGGHGLPLWWMFYDSKGKTYYVLHEVNAFDIDALIDQGALNVKEERQQEEAKKKANNSPLPGLPDLLGGGGGGDFSKTLRTGALVVAGALAVSLLMR